MLSGGGRGWRWPRCVASRSGAAPRRAVPCPTAPAVPAVALLPHGQPGGGRRGERAGRRCEARGARRFPAGARGTAAAEGPLRSAGACAGKGSGRAGDGGRLLGGVEARGAAYRGRPRGACAQAHRGAPGRAGSAAGQPLRAARALAGWAGGRLQAGTAGDRAAPAAEAALRREGRKGVRLGLIPRSREGRRAVRVLIFRPDLQIVFPPAGS